MKIYKPLLILCFIVLLDQILKIWIKTTMYPGEYFSIFGDWFYIHFTENNGMAFGFEFAGQNGKLLLSIFRIIAVFGIIWYLVKLCKENTPKGLIFSVTLILSGAIGNIIDSAFYGVIFGYESLMYGKVVDMFYFPIIESTFPEWLPWWGGEEFVFFRPVFNIADSAITTGVIIIIFFQKQFFNIKSETDASSKTVETVAENK